MASHPLGRPADVAGGVVVGLAVLAFQLAFPRELNLADESFILLGARRLLGGEALYHDFVEIIGPASFSLYALAFALGGVTITSAKVAAAAANALSATLVFTLARHVAGRLEAVLAVAVFAVGCLPVWPMASPHWLSTTLCLLCASLLLSEGRRSSPRLRAFLVGGTLALTACNQQQRGAALAVWVLVATAWTAWGDHREPADARRAGGPPRIAAAGFGRRLVWTAAGGLLVTALAIGGVVARGASLAEIYQATVATVLGGYARTFVHQVDWGGPGLVPVDSITHALPGVPAATPFVLAIELVGLVAGARRRSARSNAVRGSLLVLAGLMAASVLYYPDHAHVAFIAPFTLVVAAGVLDRARRGLTRLDPRLGVLARLLGVAALGGLALWGSGQIALARARSPILERTALGEVALTPEQHGMLRELRTRLAARPGPAPAMFAYNGDTGLSLLLGLENPVPFTFYSPGYNDDRQQRRMLEAIERRPDALLLLNLLFTKPGDPILDLVERRYRPLGGISFIQMLYEPRPAPAAGP